jgi:hypothetical protein
MRLLKKVLIAFALIPCIFIDNLFSLRRSQIVAAKTFNPLSPDKPILFYVHYSKNDTILENEKLIFENIHSLGIQICLILNSDHHKTKLLAEVSQEFSNAVAMLVVRKNKGYDLGAYRDAFNMYSKLDTTNSNKLFFMNNSLIWFPELIANYFKDMMESESDIVAGSISNQHIQHIQTFLFGAVTRTGIENLNQYFRKIKNWHFKKSIITFGELKTNIFFQEALKVSSLPGLKQLTALGLQKIHDSGMNPEIKWGTVSRLLQNRRLSFEGIAVNPSHSYWLEMFDLGFPGIKFDLVTKNPSRIQDYEQVVEKLLIFGYTFEDLAELALANKPQSRMIQFRRRIRI